jgi:hypothetical protein
MSINTKKLGWRVIKECLRRAAVPYIMYLFMGLLVLACQAIPADQETLKYILSCVCIVGGFAYNAHLLYTYGKTHYDAYLTGCLHRKNEMLGIASGGNHRVEREYRPWKGFVIGAIIALPVLIFSIVVGCFPETLAGEILGLFFVMFAAWALVPFAWFNVSRLWAITTIIFPIVISGVFYLIGAMKQKKIKDEEAERMQRVREAGRKQQ